MYPGVLERMSGIDPSQRLPFSTPRRDRLTNLPCQQLEELARDRVIILGLEGKDPRELDDVDPLLRNRSLVWDLSVCAEENATRRSLHRSTLPDLRDPASESGHIDLLERGDVDVVAQGVSRRGAR